MEPIVEQALRKWPNVPHCYGWLALDARGDWYVRDDQAQAAGPFPRVKGHRVVQRKLIEFIGRNYAADGAGNWFFQNGPQRVYVELEAAPWVWRLHIEPDVGTAFPPCGAPTIHGHTGRAARFESAWLDGDGRLFVATDIGLGLVHTLDTECAADAVLAHRWQPGEMPFDAMPQRFGYRLKPSPPSTSSAVPGSPVP